VKTTLESTLVLPEAVTPGMAKVHIQLPGRIIGAEGEHTVILEMPATGLPVIDAERLNQRCKGLTDYEFEALLERLERIATCEIIKAGIRVR